MDRNLKITNPEMLANVLKEKKVEGLKELSREEKLHIDHVGLATQSIKMINSSQIDPFVKKVVTLRLLGPILTGFDRTYLSIALELGSCEDDVIQADEYGCQVLGELMLKVDSQEFVDKFNSDEAVKKAVSNMGKSL